MKLDSNQVAFHPLSYGDWSGRVFWWEGGLYRAISEERLPFYQRLFSEGIIQDLVRRDLLIDTEVTDLQLDGYALVLKHRTVPFVSYAHEWCGEMLKAAALSVLELERELRTHGLTLEDPHPCNVLFLGPTPVWVDLGSLWPLCHRQPYAHPSHANEMFAAQFTRPLKIMAAGYQHIARCLLQDGYFCGVQHCEVEAIVATPSAKMINIAQTRAKSAARKVIPSALRHAARCALGYLPRAAPSETARAPINVQKTIREIENIRLAQSSTIWSTYDSSMRFPSFVTTAEWTEKHHSILHILSAKKPGSVLDVGSNRGWYSQLAARYGAQVVSVDFDEPSVTKLFCDAKTEHLAILPLMGDFRKLGTTTGSPHAAGITPAKRLRCDMVLALALVHHLVSAQYMNFEKIVQDLSALTRKWLVIEFIDRDDPWVRDWINDWYSWYTLDNFLMALKKEFSEIELLASNMEHRRVLLCER